MKKRLIGLLTAAMVATTALAGCSGKINDSSKGNGGSGNKDYDWVRSTDNTDDIYVSCVTCGLGEAWLTKAAQSYEDETGVHVEVYFDPQMGQNLSQAMNINKNLDDLTISGEIYDWIKWTAQEKVECLEDIMDLEYPGETDKDGNPMTLRKKIKDSVAPLGVYDNKTYVINYTYAPTGIVYNADLFKKLGYDEFPATWAELLEACKKIIDQKPTNKNGKVIKPFSWGGAVFDLNDTYKTLWAQADIEKFKAFFAYEDKNGPSEEMFMDQSRLTALEALYDLLNPVNGKSVNALDGLGAGTNVDSEIAFLNGLSAFCPTGGWFESEVASALSNADFTYKFAAVPAVEGGTRVANINLPTEYFMIPKYSNNPEGAKDFLRYMLSEENLIMMHSENQTPSAFEYDMSKCNLNDWGKQVVEMLDAYPNIFSAAPTSTYRIGALAPKFYAKDPYTLMATGTIARKDLKEEVLRYEYSNRVTKWKDWMDQIDELQIG